MHEPLSPYEMFFKQYNYPCKNCIVENYEDLKNILLNLDDKDIFNKYSNFNLRLDFYSFTLSINY